MKFRVGDIIKAISLEMVCGYSVTCSDRNWTGEVLAIDGDMIKVPCDNSSTWVNYIYFALVKGNSTKGKGKKIEYKF